MGVHLRSALYIGASSFGVVQKSADDASCRLFTSGMQAAACILHTVANLISCCCLERVGTAYHILFAVVAVGSICAMQRVWNICGCTGFVWSCFGVFLLARLYEDSLL